MTDCDACRGSSDSTSSKSQRKNIESKSKDLKKSQESTNIIKATKYSQISRSRSSESFESSKIKDSSSELSSEAGAKKTYRMKPKKSSDEKLVTGKPLNKESNEAKTSVATKRSSTEYKEEFNSKNYLKMRHEIEIKNYLLDKMKRELESKTLKGRPEQELYRLKQEILKEINVLHNMVQFAIFMQRNNRKDKWGPIPISPVSPRQIQKRPKSSPSATMKLALPKTPSGISSVSGFENLDDVMLLGEKEHCFNHLKLEEKEQKLQECNEEIAELERQLAKLREDGKRLQAKMSKQRPVTRS